MAKHKGPKRQPAAKRPPLTHFLCVPLVNASSRSQLQAALQSFSDDVCSSDASPAIATSGPVTKSPDSHRVVSGSIHPKAVRPLGSLHLTLGVMSLDQAQLSEATRFLEELKTSELLAEAGTGSSAQLVPDNLQKPGNPTNPLNRPITPPENARSRSSDALKVDLKGLESMHQAQKTSILYIKPTDGTDRLYPFCLALQKLFRDQGFLVTEDRPLKLHATVVNTIYAKGSKGQGQGHGPSANAPLKIDATQILARYQDFLWARDVTLDRIAICEMGAKKVFDDKGVEVGAEYTEVANVALPS